MILKCCLREGADKISINSAAIINPAAYIRMQQTNLEASVWWLPLMPREERDGGWNIYKNGGRVDMGIDAVEWAMKAEKLGAGEILLTSMDCDGTKAGYDMELTSSNCR